MIELDRRRVIMGGAALAAGALTPTLAWASAHNVTLFIVDARFSASQAAGAYWYERGASLLDPREVDLGRAWRTTIPQSLSGGGIAGLTLWSDYFICETFAREAGLRPEGPQVRMGTELFQWSFA